MIVAEAKREWHAGGMPPSAKQETVAASPRSFTGQYLKPMLERAPKPELVDTKPAKKARKKAAADEPDLLAAK